MKKSLFSILMTIISFVFVVLSLSVFTSCDDDDDEVIITDTIKDTINVKVSSDITTDVTWTKGHVYILQSRIAVEEGATLTIEPGVIVKGEAGTGANATALLVAKGGKLMAEGTATEPIIFTAAADKIMPGEIESPNLDASLFSMWGGLIICGSATISADAASVQIEGIPASDKNGLYGGTTDDDNSGSIKYVSVRHGGANIGEGNEINGITFGGVGSGTTVMGVEIVGNQDDGIEWFGGTVNVTDALVLKAGDDAIDTDQSWGGTLDNFIVISPGDECFELDGPEGAYVAKHTIKNGSVKVGSADGIADLDKGKGTSDSNFDMENVYFFDLDPEETQDWDELPDEYTPTFSGIEVKLPTDSATVADFFKGGMDANVTSVTTPTVGANKSKFSGWTFADVTGELSDF